MKRLGILALLIPAGCAVSAATGPAVPAPSTATSNVIAQSDAEPLGAFALYLDDRTVLLPVLRGATPTIAPGVWMSQPHAPHEVVVYSRIAQPAVTGLPTCVCSTQTDACINRGIVRSFDMGSRPPVASSSECACHGNVAPLGTVPQPRAPRHLMPEYLDGYVPCELDEPPGTPVSVAAGQVHAVGIATSMVDPCGNTQGVNMYSSWGEVQPVLTEAPAPPPPIDWQLCASSDLDLERLTSEASKAQAISRDAPDVNAEVDVAVEVRASDDDDESELRRRCAEGPEVVYPFLRNGRHCWWGQAGVPEQASWISCAPVAESCPSSVDPCGSARAFAAIERDGADWWASSDERTLLVVRQGRALVYQRSTGEGSHQQPLLEVDLGSAERPLGVLFFADATELAAAMGHDFTPAAPLSPTESCATDGDCLGGELCDPIALVCARPCSEDGDCSQRGRCGARCLQDGHCTGAPVGQCSDVFSCEDDYQCADGQCVDATED